MEFVLLALVYLRTRFYGRCRSHQWMVGACLGTIHYGARRRTWRFIAASFSLPTCCAGCARRARNIVRPLSPFRLRIWFRIFIATSRGFLCLRLRSLFSARPGCARVLSRSLRTHIGHILTLLKGGLGRRGVSSSDDLPSLDGSGGTHARRRTCSQYAGFHRLYWRCVRDRSLGQLPRIYTRKASS